MQTVVQLSSFPDLKRAPRRHSLRRMMSSSTVLLLVVIAALIIILALLILFHHNLNATKGYRLRTLERERAGLLLDQEILNMRIAKTQSLEALQSDPVVLGMQKAKNLKYVDADPAGSTGLAQLTNDSVSAD